MKEQKSKTQSSLKTVELEWLTSEQAAAYLAICVGSLANMVSQGKVPYYKLGRRNRYLKSELTELLLAGRRGK